ncbi:V-type proton ATPase subunit C isoform B [Glycine soja]|uniref:V-type proton ATPase subunit C n=1 Tax=Glycine soja TaxID=3848 RepID=A0A445GIP9_GLYSO|nr:V-type proton ATPase subunit C isoform B [Glycine soja]
MQIKFSIFPLNLCVLCQVRVSEYNNIRSQLNAINRKQTGSLAVRDLSDLVKPEDIITSENLTTLLAIVPKYSQKDWLSSYEILTNYVVPRSSKKLYEDNEYALYTVTLFSRVADNFRTSAREEGFQIRDFEYSPESHDSRKQELEKLVEDQESLRGSLLQWCYTSYGEVLFIYMSLHLICRIYCICKGKAAYNIPPPYLRIAKSLWAMGYEERKKGYAQNITMQNLQIAGRNQADDEKNNGQLLDYLHPVFSSWMHFCAVRVFTESILRYGLPPSFLACVLAPSVKAEKKVRSILEGLSDSSNSAYWKTEDEGVGMAGLAGDADAHPYVSFTINLV